MKKLWLVLISGFFVASCQTQYQQTPYKSLDCREKTDCLNFAIRHCQKTGKKPSQVRYSYHQEREGGGGYIGSRYRRFYQAYYYCN